jgi:hypothetical protein
MMKGKLLLPLIFVITLALSRIPGLMPLNFSVVYAFVFCCGVFFRGAIAWWLPLITMLATDSGLNLYYDHAHPDYAIWNASNLANLSFNYLAYVVLLLLGSRFRKHQSFFKVVGGGLLGACLFYLVTNTASWFFNPSNSAEYTKTLTGWIIALTKGVNGFPQTLEFFRNTLLSGGLFTALFAVAAKFTAESPADKTAGLREPAGVEDEAPATEPEEAKA